MFRRARSLSAILALAAIAAVDSIDRHDFAFAGPQRFGEMFNAGGGAGGGGGKEGDDPEAPPEPMIPKAEADKAFKSRDQAKAGIRAFATLLGIDPSDVKIVANAGDKDNPFKLEAEGIDDIPELLKEARAARKKKDKTGDGEPKWADRESELTTAHQKQLKKLTDNHTTKQSAYDRWVDAQMVAGQIRSACIAEGAIDDDQTGNFDDIVALTSRRLRVDKSFDDETGDLKVKSTPLNEDGTPMLDGKGQPATVRALVADFLTNKPKFKQANFRGGPGAGGYGNPPKQTQNAGGGNQNTPVNPALKFFGLPNRAA